MKVEVDGEPRFSGTSERVTRSGRSQEMVVSAGETFEQALSGVIPASTAIVSKLRLTEPSEIELEFGIKISADAGVVVARTGGEANFRVAVKWSAK